MPVQVIEKPKHKKRRPGLNGNNYKVNKYEALALAFGNQPLKDIAEGFKVSVSAISQTLKPYKDALQLVQAFGGNNKDKFFELVQMMIGGTLNKTNIKKMQGLQKITGMAILQDKIDKIRGDEGHHGLIIAPVNIITINTSGKDNEKSVVIEVVKQEVLPHGNTEKKDTVTT